MSASDKDLRVVFHTFVTADQDPDVDALRRKESTRLKMLVRLFREDLEDGEKVFVLLRKDRSAGRVRGVACHQLDAPV